LYKTEAKGDRRLEFALGLVIAGAVGNIIDRVVYGYVIDFFDFYWGTYHWPAFNIADSSIVTGVALLILCGKKDRAPV
jgi:signal peptidase II